LDKWLGRILGVGADIKENVAGDEIRVWIECEMNVEINAIIESELDGEIKHI
jgi:hypothetical protein